MRLSNIYEFVTYEYLVFILRHLVIFNHTDYNSMEKENYNDKKFLIL